MRRIASRRRAALRPALLACGTLAVLVLLRGADGLLSRLVRLDLSFLALPVTLCGALLTLGRLALLLRGTELAERLSLRRAGTAARSVLRLEDALPGIHRMLTDVGLTALGLGLLSAADALPEVISDHPWAPDIASAAHYLGSFDSLAVWGALILTPFIAARAVATVRPDVGAIVGFPWAHLAAFGAAYALLGAGGALEAAFGLDGAWPLMGFGLAAALSYAAAALRRAEAVAPPSGLRGLRWARWVTEVAWPAAVWLAAVALARAAEHASGGPGSTGPGSADLSYLEVLHSLSAAQLLAVLAPFALIHCARAFWSAAARLFDATAGHLALLTAAYVLFSEHGALATAFGIGVSGMLAALIGATLLFYAAATLANAAHIELTAGRRYVPLAMGALGVLSALAAAAALALVVGAAISHLPAASVVLLDQPATRDVWEGFLLVAAGLYEARYPLAGLAFTAAAVPRLIRATAGWIAPRRQPLLAAVGHVVVGCLCWLIASGLSEFGHGFLLAGAVAAAGMCSLALGRLASYAASSLNPTVADIAGWLSASRARAFTLGAAAALYVLLLRPVVYGLVELAVLYEYIALLAVLLAVLMSVVNRLRVVADPPETASRGWTGWHRHRQSLERKADPRAALPDAMRQRYLDRGDWRPLGAYLLALLYRSGASWDAMAAVCRSLRRGAVTPLAWAVLGRRRRESARTAALERAVDAAGRALADPAPQPERLGEDDVRRLGAAYVDGGADTESLAVVLIVAHCQRGADLHEAADRWFALVDTSAPFPERFAPPWGRSVGRPLTAPERLDLVDGAVAELFGSAPQQCDPPPHGSPATSVAGGAA